MIDEKMAVELALKALKEDEFRFLSDTLDISYRERGLSIGSEKKGWVICYDLDVPKSFEPNFVFVQVSDPEGEVYIPPVI